MASIASIIRRYRNERDTVRAVQGGQVAELFENTDRSPFGPYMEPDRSNQVANYNSLTSAALKDLDSDQVRESLAKSSPDASKAVRDFVKYCNAGFVLQPESHPVFDHCFDVMADLDGGFDAFLGACFRDMFLHGGTLTESNYIDNRLQRIVALNPNSLIFNLESDERGEYFARYQRQNGELVSLQDDPTIAYTPVFKSSTNPRGTNFMDAAVWHMTMSVDFFQAYKATIEKIAWPKVLIHVDRKLLKESGYTDAKIDEYVRKTVTKLKQELKKLKPGAILTYGSEIAFQGIDSAMNYDSLGHTPEVMKIIAKQIIRGLGTTQLFAGLSDSITETRAKYETADYSHMIIPCQNALAATLTRQFNLALRMAGSSDIASFHFVRVLFGDIEINARTYRSAQEAFRARDDGMMKLLEWLKKAVEDERMNDDDAREHFRSQMEIREIPELLRGLH